jgi:hypothetical protein
MMHPRSKGMKVYRIDHDTQHYQYFLVENDDEVERLVMDCTPKADTWSSPSVFVFKPMLKAGDFYQFEGDLLITSPRATEVLRTHLEMAGELLPLPYQGEEYTVLNVTECINCLDGDKTEWAVDDETGERLYPEKYVFHRDRFTESALFKIPETHGAEILVVEGLHDPEEEFRYMVEQANLKGLIFVQFWSSDA